MLNLLWSLSCAAPVQPIDERAYVWQRDWTPAVVAAVSERGPTFSALNLLVAELTPAAGGQSEPAVAWVHPDPAAIGAQPVVAVVRVGLGPQGAAALDGLPALALEAVGRLRGEGVAVAGVELDLDIPTARLASYVPVFAATRAGLGLPLSITGLPDWSSSPDLPAVLAQVDGWTLQVHDFVPPRDAEHLVPLLDADAALRAIAGAEALGVPFRVALPAYAYAVHFDTSGAFAGLSAEGGPTTRAPRDRVLRADPVAVAAVVAALRADPPSHLQGINWFRLPVDGDRLGWAWPTLQAVRQGRAPQPDLRALLVDEGGGLYTVAVENQGEEQGPAPAIVVVAELPAIAADVYADAALTVAPAAVQFAPSTRPLEPGARSVVGWVRFPEGATPALVSP